MIEWDIVTRYLSYFKTVYPGFEIVIRLHPAGFVNFSLNVEDKVYSSGTFPAESTEQVLFSFSLVVLRSLRNAYGERVLSWENGKA